MQVYRSLDEVVETGTIAPNSIINADCLEAMKFIPDKSIDCIICDLPYGVTACKWDVVIPFDLLWEQYKRIIKLNGAIVLFGSQPFTSALVMSNPKWFKYEWVWNKKKPGNIFLAKIQPMKTHELISVFANGTPSYNPIMTKRDEIKRTKNYGTGKAFGGKKEKEDKVYEYTEKHPISILESSNASQKGKTHPTQKPVKLIEYLAKTYTLENEIIVDNTAGSGTLAIACINTNRRYICIEKDPGYFDVMRNRIENHDPNALTTPKKARKPKAITEGQLTLFG